MDIRKIIAPTDFSELSLDGLHYALELARSQEAEVVVYHAMGYEQTGFEVAGREFQPVEQRLEERKEFLDRFVKEHFAEMLPSVKVRLEVAVGPAYQKIPDKAEEEGADLIVMSTHGRTGFRRLLLGSVAEQVVRSASCPVLTVRPKERAETSTVAA